MHVKQLAENEKILMKQRSDKMKQLQEKGICYTCYDFNTGDIFPDEGLIFYEDEKVICKFEKYPKVVGHTIILAKDHYEDISEMPLDLGIHILKISDAIIKLHKEILGAEKIYLCTLCEGKNHLHFHLFPRLKGETKGFGIITREPGIIMEYHETVELYKLKLREIRI